MSLDAGGWIVCTKLAHLFDAGSKLAACGRRPKRCYPESEATPGLPEKGDAKPWRPRCRGCIDVHIARKHPAGWFRRRTFEGPGQKNELFLEAHFFAQGSSYSVCSFEENGCVGGPRGPYVRNEGRFTTPFDVAQDLGKTGLCEVCKACLRNPRKEPER